MTDPDFRSLCAELVDDYWPCHYQSELLNRARAALSQPEPVAPTDEELDELFTEIDQSGEALSWRPYARAAIARWGRPAIEPVPVSERPWEREGWCDAEGQCWWFRPADFDEDDPALAWYLDSSPAPELLGWEIHFYGYTHSLPHHALFTPDATNA